VETGLLLQLLQRLRDGLLMLLLPILPPRSGRLRSYISTYLNSKPKSRVKRTELRQNWLMEKAQRFDGK